MKFRRVTVPVNGNVTDAMRLCDRLRCGRWLVEADTVPPPAHRPALLLAGRATQGAIAVTLRSATLLRLNLGQALIAWLAAAGCAVAELAALALHEVLINAAIHGNLAVEFGPSRVWNELLARQNLVDAALEDPILAARAVTVAIGWDHDSVSAVIADQGAGYQPAAGPPAPDAARRGAGRGLMIAHAAARVDMLQGGRSVRLVFERLDAGGPR